MVRVPATRAAMIVIRVGGVGGRAVGEGMLGAGCLPEEECILGREAMVAGFMLDGNMQVEVNRGADGTLGLADFPARRFPDHIQETWAMRILTPVKQGVQAV